MRYYFIKCDRCLNRSNFFPPEKPLSCEESRNRDPMLICCNDTDFCNSEKLTQPLISFYNITSTGKSVPLSLMHFLLTS